MFDNYSFGEIPLNCDIYVIDESYLHEYESSMVNFFNGTGKGEPVGYVGYVAARAIKDSLVELSWYPNVYDRFHEVSIVLPRKQFICCVGSWQCDEKPHIFVKNDWLESLYLRSYSIFALIDAIDVKKAIENGGVTRKRLIELRHQIDCLAKKHTDISFISFADSLLLKSNWSVGHFKSDVNYSYEPEVFIHLANEINAIYKETLELGTYAVIAQGGNEYYDDQLLHISPTKNHISLNSLGIPFAQLMEIESAARKAIKENIHERAEVYMDEKYFHSIKFKHRFKKNTKPFNSYKTKMMSAPSKYYYSSLNSIIGNLEQ